jgi:hypothetical protein
MRWSGHVALMAEKMIAYRYSWESHTDKDHWEDQDVGGRIILNWILER